MASIPNRTIFSPVLTRVLGPGVLSTLPSARQDLVTTTERTPVSFNLLANDVIRDPLRSVTIGTPTNGTVEFTQTSINPAAPTANVIYTPNAGRFAYLAVGERATDSFTYTVTDVDGDTSTATVLVTITGVNDAVQIVGGKTTTALVEDSSSTLRDTGSITFSDLDLTDRHTVTVAPAQVVISGPVAANFAPAAGFGTFTAAVVENLTDQNNQGVVNWTFSADNSAVQRLAAGQTATQTYALTVADRYGSSVVQNVTVTLTGVNDGPTLRSAVSVGNVIEDAKPAVYGTLVFLDPDLIDTHSVRVVPNGNEYSGTFTAQITDQATGDGTGTVRWDFSIPNGSFQYLGQGQSIVQSYVVTIADSSGGTIAQTVTVTINGVDDAPVAVADFAAATEDAKPVFGSLATNDYDVDNGAVLTYSLFNPVAGLTLNPNGSYVFDASNAAYQALSEGQTQNITVYYTVRDEFGLNAISSLTITVTGTNDAPQAVADVASATEDGAIVTGSVATNDVDGDNGSVLTYSLAAPVAGLTFNSDGSYSFNPGDAAYQSLGAGASTDVVANYTLTDQFGATSSSTLTITVAGTNDAPTTSAVTLVANRLGNGGFDLTPDYSGWTVSTGSTGTVGGFTSTATIDRSGTIIPGDNAVAHLFYNATTSSFGTGYGPRITSDPFAGSAGDTVSFTYVLASGTDQAVGTAYIRDAVSGQIVQTIFNYQVPFIGSTGVQTVNLTLATSGTYTIDFQLGSYDATGGTAIGAQLDIGFAGILSNGVPENAPFTFGTGRALLLANSTDSDPGDTLTINPFTVTSALGATITLAANGSLTIDGRTRFADLTQGQTATDTFTYQVRDSHGGVSTATASYTLAGVADDTIVATGGINSLVGGSGNDVFVFAAGNAAGDHVVDFNGNGPATGDSFLFTGYGTAAQGATFVQIDATHWQINSADGTIHDVITIDNAAPIDPSDYLFS